MAFLFREESYKSSRANQPGKRWNNASKQIIKLIKKANFIILRPPVHDRQRGPCVHGHWSQPPDSSLPNERSPLRSRERSQCISNSYRMTLSHRGHILCNHLFSNCCGSFASLMCMNIGLSDWLNRAPFQGDSTDYRS